MAQPWPSFSSNAEVDLQRRPPRFFLLHAVVWVGHLLAEPQPVIGDWNPCKTEAPRTCLRNQPRLAQSMRIELGLEKHRPKPHLQHKHAPRPSIGSVCSGKSRGHCTFLPGASEAAASLAEEPSSPLPAEPAPITTKSYSPPSCCACIRLAERRTVTTQWQDFYRVIWRASSQASLLHGYVRCKSLPLAVIMGSSRRRLDMKGLKRRLLCHRARLRGNLSMPQQRRYVNSSSAHPNLEMTGPELNVEARQPHSSMPDSQ